MDRADRIQLWISYAIRISLVIAVIIAIVNQQWLNVFLITTIIFLTFFPAIIERNAHVYLPIEFQLTISCFVYAALYLGELQDFYFRFWWWDVMLHSISGLVFGFIGFLIVYILNYEKATKVRMGPRFIALFSFTFALSIGAIWEIFEFALDNVLGFQYMQKSGLVDTMWDLIIDAMGAFLISILGYLYVKKGGTVIFNRLIRKFIKENPKIFGEE